MNQSDSERIAALFEQLNFSPVVSPKEADFLVINACSVRQTAVDRIWGLVKNFENRRGKVKKILTGCLSEKDRKKFLPRFDFVFSIKDLLALEKFLRGKAVFAGNDYFNLKPKSNNRFRLSVPIMTGCDNYCSYCVVPYVRGRETSRPVLAVLDEIKKFSADGGVEVLLLGQNVNSYQPGDTKKFSADNPFKQNFAKLLWEINQIPGLRRVHFISSHPKDLSDDLIQALILPKQVNYLHLALQSGDNKILKKMNRKYSAEEFEALVKKVRQAKPSISLGTDIIVGFPGETREQFENTLRFYEKIKFDIAYVAMYSARPQTAAAKMPDDVPYAEKKKRWHELQDLMEQICLEKNKKYVGREVEVLIDAVGTAHCAVPTETHYCEGNSLEMKRVRVYGAKARPGEIIMVKIKEAKEWLLTG